MKSVLFLALLGCAHTELGERHVIEADVGDWVYRRYQKVEDIEFQVPGNPGIGHTAVYQRRDTVGHASVPRSAMAVAFVTEYERAEGVEHNLSEQIAGLKGYRIVKNEQGQLWMLFGLDGDSWAVWASGRYVVKVGVPADKTLPVKLFSAYRRVYP